MDANEKKTQSERGITKRFMYSVLILLAVMVGAMEYYGIENNTKPALILVALVIVYCVVNVRLLMKEMKGVSVALKEGTAYKMPANAYITYGINAAILVGMVLICRANALIIR